MKQVTFHVHALDTASIKKDIQDLLKDRGFCDSHTFDTGEHCVIIASELEAAASADQPSEVPAAEIDTPPIEVAATDATEPELNIEDIPKEEPVPSTTSVLTPLEQGSKGKEGQVVIRTLLSSCVIPFSVDLSLDKSVLKVKNLKAPSAEDTSVSFEYCSSSFNFPVAASWSADDSIVNMGPFFSDTSIRVLINIVGTDIDLPCLITLKEGEPTELVFGSDLFPAVIDTLEGNKN